MCQEAAGPWATGYGWQQLTERRRLRGGHQSLLERSPGLLLPALWGPEDVSPAGSCAPQSTLRLPAGTPGPARLATHTLRRAGASVSEALAERWPGLTTSGDSVLQAAWPGLSCWPPAGYRAKPLTQKAKPHPPNPPRVKRTCSVATASAIC